MPRALQHPARLVPLAFLIAIAVGTGLLMLPWANTDPTTWTPPLIALFTATSAVCVTGLAVVDTGTYWSPLGQAIIMLLCQIGGFGIMTLATLLSLLVVRRLRLRSQLVAQAETRTLALGDVRTVLLGVAALTLIVELVIALALTLRLWLSYDYSIGRGLWYGAFHAVTAFTHGSFALYPDSLIRFATDPWICVPIMTAIVVPSLGFPVLFELGRQHHRPARWSLHTKITVLATVILLVGGAVAFLVAEWSNPRTAGPLDVPAKLLVSAFHSVVSRTSGFNTVDIGQLHPETLVLIDVLMFIGGGSAGTAGGIKVTTFFVLAFVIWAEVRGEKDVVAFGRRIDSAAQRQALTVALLGVAVVGLGTATLLILTDHTLDAVLFEAISAFATVGLSTGITPTLPGAAQLVLVVLMFVGRVGTITAAAALALRSRDRRYRYPEERPIVG